VNPSASSFERALQCPASFALPQVRETTEASEQGTKNHDNVEEGLEKGGRELPQVAKNAVEDAESIQTEVSYAINVVTGGVRETGRHRAYGDLTEEEVGVTTDLVVKKRDGSIFVWDWKSRKRVTGIRENLQLRAQAYAVLKLSGVDALGYGIGYLDNSHADVDVFDSFDAADLLQTLRRMMQGVAAAILDEREKLPPRVHAGSWCEYCPAMPYCPAYTRLAKSFLGEVTELSERLQLMTVSEVGVVHERLKPIKKILEALEKGVRLRAQAESVPLPGGKKRLVLIDSSRTSFDKEAALARLTENGISTEGLTKTTSFATLREVNATKKEGT